MPRHYGMLFVRSDAAFFAAYLNDLLKHFFKKYHESFRTVGKLRFFEKNLIAVTTIKFNQRIDLVTVLQDFKLQIKDQCNVM